MITPADEGWAEGPCAIRVGAKHRLYYASPKTGFAAFESGDLKSWNPMHARMVPPGGYRHGTVIRISPQEAMRLLEHDYGV